jgi:hypothetical protein
MPDDVVRQKFIAALDALVVEVKADQSVLAAILCGSLSHDTVWARSDIDLVLVTVDDSKIAAGDISLDADGVNVHAFLMPRQQFRQTVEGAVQNSFMHAFLAKGRLLYTHDPTIADLCARLPDLGSRDLDIQLLRAATGALPAIDKAHKWLATRGDLDYTALWILFAAMGLARIEVLASGAVADREVLPQALGINPAFFTLVYTDLLNTKKTRAGIDAALAAVDTYVEARTPALFRLVVDHLRDAGEARACSEIDAHFKRHFDIGGVTTACEYLAHQGLIGQAALPAHLTKKSRVSVQELAFFYTQDLPHAIATDGPRKR